MNEFLELLELLVGRQLDSIRPGRGIYVRSLEADGGRIRITDASGRQRTRSIQELGKLWDMLRRQDYVHVDSALGGSGSSRNQPETILANLPTVEWLIVQGRKCLTMVDGPSHPVGTVRRMDDVSAALLIESHREPISEVVVTVDVAGVSALLDSEYGAPQAVEPGVYRYSTQAGGLLLVMEGATGLPLAPGAYPVLAGRELLMKGGVIRVGGQAFTHAELGGVQFLSPAEDQ
jgi:hypothetical protein